MKMKYWFLSLLATTALSIPAANAAPLLDFGQVGTVDTVTGTNNGVGTTTITTTNTPITIDQIDVPGLIPPDISAFLTLSATSSGAASIPIPGFVAQPFSGTFSITNGATNYLSGTFTDAIFGSGASLTLSASSDVPGESVSFTSNVIDNSLFIKDRAIAFAFTDVAPPVGISNGSLSSFNSTVGGNMSSNIPEASTWAMMLLGFMGLAYAGLRGGRKVRFV